MNSEPRHPIYQHIYQLSWRALNGHGDLKWIMGALMLDPLAASDVRETGEWPSSRFADFCAHTDKNARQAALDTLATWLKRREPSLLLGSVDMLVEYDSRIALWAILDLPGQLPMIMSAAHARMASKAVSLANAFLAHPIMNIGAVEEIETIRNSFMSLMQEVQYNPGQYAPGMYDCAMAMRYFCNATLHAMRDQYTLGFASDAGAMIKSAVSATTSSGGYSGLSYADRKTMQNVVCGVILDEMADRILRYPYCH